MKKKIINIFLLVSFIMSLFPSMIVAAEKVETAEITVYENTFDNGINSVKSVSNEYLTYDASSAKNIRDAQVDGNQGIRGKRESYLNERTFLFDFTKGGSEHGIYSGVITGSFDFSMDKESPADYAIIGVNMSKSYEGGRMIYFGRNATYQFLDKVSDWGNAVDKGTALDPEKVYNIKFVINLNEGKADYYLDNELLKTQTNWMGTTVNNLSFAVSGLIDYFDNFKITVKYPDAIENTVESENIGNIFYDDEDMVFTLKVKNRHNEEIREDINIKIWDAYNTLVYDEKKSVPVGKDSHKEIEFMPYLPRFGTYFMTVTSVNSEEFNTRLSRSVKAKALNEKSGVCAHFDGRHPMDVPGMFDIMANAGFGTVRTDWGWRVNEDGTVFDYDNNGGIFEETINEANEHGIEILAIFGVSHKNYSHLNTDGGLNTSDKALKAYREYTKEVAKDLKGKVDFFEIGNENNYDKRYAAEDDIGVNTIVLSNGRTLIDKNYVYTYPNEGDYNTFNKTPWDRCDIKIELVTEEGETYASLKAVSGNKVLHDGTKAWVFETGDNYAKLLKAAYYGIKEGNPDALVLTSGSGLGYIDPDWSANRNMQEFSHQLLGQMEKENDYCFDVYATHPYHTAQAPEVVDRWIMNQDWSMQADVGNRMFETYNVPEDKTLWATEFGYSARDSKEDSSKALQRAAWIVRTMLLNEIGGYHDKMYLYDILNDGLKADNSEHNFGTICYCNNEKWNNVTAYAAKPQYLAMAQYNKMLAGYDFVEVVEDGINYNAKFKKGDDTVFVLWDIDNKGDAVKVFGKGHRVTAYDYFGNIIAYYEGAEEISVPVGENPVYVEFDVLETHIEPNENITTVHIVNDTDKEMKPCVFRIVKQSDGRIVHIELTDTYYVGSEQKDKILPGEYAKVNVYTPEMPGYTNIVMAVDNLENLMPICRSVNLN